MNKTDLKKIGFSDRFLAERALYKDLYIGRIFSQYKDLYKVMCEDNELIAEVSGKFRFDAKASADYPAVGDFVTVDRDTNIDGHAIIHNVLSRKSVFTRRAAGTSNEVQVVASNIDIVFICVSLNNDFNLRRIERYLSIAWDSGARPVIVLTKSDLCCDINCRLNEVNSIAVGVDVLATSSLHEDGPLQILDYIKKGQTAAFIGSSGVGKSTLINCLLGENIIKTSGLRDDDKGRHTTTHRELIMLSGGGMVIDTPGMREIGLENADLAKAFSDIDVLAGICKFSDCTHTSEPDCAVLKAVKDNLISADRLSSYKKLKKEAGYDGLNSRQIENAKIKEMFKSVGGMKNARKLAKEKNARKHGY